MGKKIPEAVLVQSAYKSSLSAAKKVSIAWHFICLSGVYPGELAIMKVTASQGLILDFSGRSKPFYCFGGFDNKAASQNK